MRRIIVSALLLFVITIHADKSAKAQSVAVNKDAASPALTTMPEIVNTNTTQQPLTETGKLTTAISVAGMQVFPNPVKGPLVTIQIETEQAGLHIVRLYNEFSKLLKTMSVKLVRGSQSVLFDLGELAPGYYSIQVTGSFSKAMTLLVK